MGAMEKIRSTETRCIDGKDVLVENIFVIDYDGNYRHSCHRAKIDNQSHDFFGYPTDDDIRKSLLT